LMIAASFSEPHRGHLIYIASTHRNASPASLPEPDHTSRCLHARPPTRPVTWPPRKVSLAAHASEPGHPATPSPSSESWPSSPDPASHRLLPRELPGAPRGGAAQGAAHGFRLGGGHLWYSRRRGQARPPGTSWRRRRPAAQPEPGVPRDIDPGASKMTTEGLITPRYVSPSDHPKPPVPGAEQQRHHGKARPASASTPRRPSRQRHWPYARIPGDALTRGVGDQAKPARDDRVKTGHLR
jgi:hypothetical protein